MALLSTVVFGTSLSPQRAILSALPISGIYMTGVNYSDQKKDIESFPQVPSPVCKKNLDEEGAFSEMIQSHKPAVEASKVLAGRAIRYLKNWQLYHICGLLSDALTLLVITTSFKVAGIFAGPLPLFFLRSLCCGSLLVRSVCFLNNWDRLSKLEANRSLGLIHLTNFSSRGEVWSVLLTEA